MPLYDITNRPYLVETEDAENYDVLQKAMKVVGTQRFAKDTRIVAAAIQRAVDTARANNTLMFTKAGFLVGKQAITPHADVLHIWTTAEMAYPTLGKNTKEADHAGEQQLKFIGGMVRWQISLLPDTWLVIRRESGTFNKYTGKEILISEYWINNDFVFAPVPKKQEFTLEDLKHRFGGAK